MVQQTIKMFIVFAFGCNLHDLPEICVGTCLSGTDEGVDYLMQRLVGIWSGIQNSVTDQAIGRSVTRMSKPEAKTL